MKNIVCYGEVLWDVLPTGKKLGGAPLNVALRAKSLGNNITVISSVGNDPLGRELMDQIKSYSAGTDHIQINNTFATSEVIVKLSESGSATYEIKMPCAWDYITLQNKDVEAVEASDAFIFGSLVARSRQSRDTLFALVEKSNFNVFDVNLRPPHYTQSTIESLMKHADFIKFNDHEIFEICRKSGFQSQSLEACIKFTANSTNTSQICVTRGEKGGILFNNDQFYYNPGYKITVADTVGAGDSFLASLVSKLLNGTKPQEALDFACAAGAMVASKSGANPAISNAEIDALIKGKG